MIDAPWARPSISQCLLASLRDDALATIVLSSFRQIVITHTISQHHRAPAVCTDVDVFNPILPDHLYATP